MKKITVTIGKGGGSSELKTEGFSGGACKIASQNLKALLGDVNEQQETAEFYNPEHNCDTVSE